MKESTTPLTYVTEPWIWAKKNPKNPYQGLAFLTEPGRELYYRTGPSLSKAHATAPQQPGPTQAVGGSGPLALCGFPTALWCSRPVSVRDSCDSISQRALGCLFFQGGNENRALLSDVLQESSPPGHHSKKETVCEKPMPFPASVHSPGSWPTASRLYHLSTADIWGQLWVIL